MRKRIDPRVQNADGTYKTFDQMMRAQMTVLQYGRWLRSQQADRRQNGGQQ